MRPVGTNGGPVASARGRGGVADRRAVGCQPRRAGGRVGASGPSWPSTAGARAVRAPRRRGLLCRRHDRALRRGRRGHGDRVPHPGRSGPDPRGDDRDEAGPRGGPGQGAGALGRGVGGGPRHVPEPGRRPPRGATAGGHRSGGAHGHRPASVPTSSSPSARTGPSATPITSPRAWRPSRPIRAMAEPPRLLHARFPMRGPILVDVLVEWLTAHPERFIGTAAFGHALKVFADGSSMLGFAADHLKVEWFPAGSFIIEQGEPATELFCILSGSAAIVVESDDGGMHHEATTGCRLLRRRGRARIRSTAQRPRHRRRRRDLSGARAGARRAARRAAVRARSSPTVAAAEQRGSHRGATPTSRTGSRST